MRSRSHLQLSIRVGLMIGILFVLLCLSLGSAIAQDSSQNQPDWADKGDWVLIDKSSESYKGCQSNPNYKCIYLSEEGNSITGKETLDPNNCGWSNLGKITWTIPSSVLNPGTKQKITMTSSIEADVNPDGYMCPQPINVDTVAMLHVYTDDQNFIPVSPDDEPPTSSISLASYGPKSTESRNCVWDVPWGRMGDVLTVKIGYSGAGGVIDVYYTYTYSQGQYGPSTKEGSTVSEENQPQQQKRPLDVTLVAYPENPTDVDVIEIEAEVSGDYKSPLSYVWYMDNVKLEGETGYKIRFERGVLSRLYHDYQISVQVTDNEGNIGLASTMLNVIEANTGIRGDVLEAVSFDLIPKAIVSITSLTSGVTKTVHVDPDGKYSAHLLPGHYKVSASAPGYLTESGTFGDDVKVLSPHDEPYCIDCYTTFNFRLVSISGFCVKNFQFADWGAYKTKDNYFIGYVQEPTQKMVDAGEQMPYLWKMSDNKDLAANGQATKVLLDNNQESTLLSKSSPLNLKEGYQLTIKAIDDNNNAYLELSKNGQVVDNKVIKSLSGGTIADNTYYYKADIGKTKGIVQIAVYFKFAFTGSDELIGSIAGAFQISDSPIDI